MPITDQAYAPPQFKTVLGKRMAYLDSGPAAAGQPTYVFQHGNPTSSYLWRNVMRRCEGLGRLVACDLIGMGESDKLDAVGPASYGYVEHRRYLDDLWAQLNLGERIVLVLHDWGSALGFDWALRHRDRVAGLVYMEALVQPVTWSDWPDNARRAFQGFRSLAGDAMILEKNIFVERVLPGSVMRPLTDTEMAVYRRPYLQPGEARRPTLSWPREIPIDGEPAAMVELIHEYGQWLKDSPIPKLFINADPGSILVGRPREFCRTWANQREVTVKGIHFIQEDSADEIGAAIASFDIG